MLRDDQGRPRVVAWTVVLLTVVLLGWAIVWAALEPGEDRFWLLAFWKFAPPSTFALWLLVPRRGMLRRLAVATIAAAMVFVILYEMPRIADALAGP